MNPRRDLDLQSALLHDPPGAVAVGTGVLDDSPGAPALRAGLGPNELAEGAPRDLLEPAGTAAHVAGYGGGAGRDAVSSAGSARDRDRERNVARDPRRSLGE